MGDTIELYGVSASPGLALGSYMIIEDIEHDDFMVKRIESKAVSGELHRLQTALDDVENQLVGIKNRALEEGRQENADVMDAHLMILLDPVFAEGFKTGIEKDLMTAEGAVQNTVNANAAMFENMDNAYLRERAQDIRDIGGRIINALLGIEMPDVSRLERPTILIANDIPPSMMASVDKDNLLGIVTEIGGKTSHTAILASNMGIPAVMGCENIVSKILDDQNLKSISQNDKKSSKTQNDIVFVDGGKGLFKMNLDQDFIKNVKEDIAREANIKVSLEALKDSTTATQDGVHIQLAANVMGPDEVEAIRSVGAEGVGLYRSEFLFMDRNTLPTEDEQYEAYKAVVEGMKGKPVIIRTMDIGGDKEVEYLNLDKEMNPFLGYRALRICLDRPDMFETQLRAILRSSAHGKALIMFPMVSALEEIRLAKEHVEAAKAQLREAGHDFDENIEVGIMIEIPSAAMIADILIKEVDFFSIGSNDLTQYTVAVDRMNQQIGALYNSYHPAMIRLIKNVIDAARGEGGHKFAGMCGEMAGDPKATLLLVGLGLQEFSVSPAKLLRIRKLINGLDSVYASEIAAKALALGTAEEIEALLFESLPEQLKMFV